MPKKYPYKLVLDTIKSELRSEENKYKTTKELIDTVTDLIGLKNSIKVKTLVDAMVESGSIVKKYDCDYGHILDFRSPRMTDEERETLKNADAFKSRNEELEKEITKSALELVEIKNELVDTQIKLTECNESGGVFIIEDKDGERRELEGHHHSKFSHILTLAKARKNIFVYGPTGCGKSFICKQVADALGLPYYFVSCTAGMSEGVLGGRLLPVGENGSFSYVISEFIKAYEEGGLFLLDEIDAADPNVLLLINAALANGKMSVPNRPSAPVAKRHKDFICVAAANTVGTGGNRMYSGRNKLDGATLDRFMIGKVYMDYDLEVEKALCPNDALRKLLLDIRKAINEMDLERAMSTRFMSDAYDMVEEGWTFKQITDAFFCGWREDERCKVETFVAQNK